MQLKLRALNVFARERKVRFQSEAILPTRAEGYANGEMIAEVTYGMAATRLTRAWTF